MAYIYVPSSENKTRQFFLTHVDLVTVSTGTIHLRKLSNNKVVKIVTATYLVLHCGSCGELEHSTAKKNLCAKTKAT